MKKSILTLAALALAASPALASKARVAALQDPKFLVDSYEIVSKPHTIAGHNWATMEFGNAAATTQNAEGGFVKSDGAAAWGLYLGYNSPWVAGRSIMNNSTTPATTYMLEENPLDFAYAMKGDVTWGVGLHYSASDKKASTNQPKQALQHLTFSAAAAGTWDFYANLGLTNTAQYNNGTEYKYTGSSGMILYGGYWMDTNYIYGTFTSGGAKSEPAGTTETKISSTEINLGYESTSKLEGGQFFFGGSYNTKSTKGEQGSTEQKEAINYIAVLMGLETDAASWLTLRTSITQDILMSSTKTTTNGTGEADSPRADNTTVAAGAGIKWGKMAMDGTLSGATTGTVNANSLLAMASFTYNW